MHTTLVTHFLAQIRDSEFQWDSLWYGISNVGFPMAPVQSSDSKIAKEKSSGDWLILFDMCAHNCLLFLKHLSLFSLCFLKPGKNTHLLVLFSYPSHSCNTFIRLNSSVTYYGISNVDSLWVVIDCVSPLLIEKSSSKNFILFYMDVHNCLPFLKHLSVACGEEGLLSALFYACAQLPSISQAPKCCSDQLNGEYEEPLASL